MFKFLTEKGMTGYRTEVFYSLFNVSVTYIQGQNA